MHSIHSYTSLTLGLLMFLVIFIPNFKLINLKRTGMLRDVRPFTQFCFFALIPIYSYVNHDKPANIRFSHALFCFIFRFTRFIPFSWCFIPIFELIFILGGISLHSQTVSPSSGERRSYCK